MSMAPAKPLTAAPSSAYGHVAFGDPDDGWRVVAVEPEGPAARVVVRVGDEIRGCGPAREMSPRVGTRRPVLSRARSSQSHERSSGECL